MQTLEGRPDYQVIIRTIDDLNAIMVASGLPPVRTQQNLEQIQETYLRRFGNSRMFEQEYHVSFEEQDAAAVYGEALSKLQNEKRDEHFNLYEGHPVYVMFDIGSAGKQSDATAWIAFQYFNNKIFIYDCGEGHGKALPEYVDDLQSKHYFNKIAYLILPWDAGSHEVSIRETPADMMRKRFANVAVLARGTNIWTAPGLPTGQDADTITMVQSVRLALYNTFINGVADDAKKIPGWDKLPNADLVINCMENYKYGYDNKKQEWSPYPVHDKYSHIMDTVRYLVQATQDLDFFGGQLYDSGFKQTQDSYTTDWAGAW
jgi:hypothetical protein